MIIDQTVSPLLALLISAVVILFARGVLEELLRNDTFRERMLAPAIKVLVLTMISVLVGPRTFGAYSKYERGFNNG